MDRKNKWILALILAIGASFTLSTPPLFLVESEIRAHSVDIQIWTDAFVKVFNIMIVRNFPAIAVLSLMWIPIAGLLWLLDRILVVVTSRLPSGRTTD